MSRENGGTDLQPGAPSLLAAAAGKFARMGSNRSLSPSASKYRVSSLLAATGIGVTTTAGAPVTLSGPASSPTMRKLQDLVRQASVKGNRNSLRLSDAVVGGDTPGHEAGNSTSPTRGKLPQKIRASVTRMRSQLSITSNNSAGESPGKSRHRNSSFFGLGSGPTTGSLRRRSSRPRYEKTSVQSGVVTAQEVSPTTSPKPRSPEILPTSNSDPVFVLRFMELLRPLQTSMRSLRDAEGVSDDEDDEDEEEADALFRQHEREHSRILRICCSLDNLLFGIADQVQEHKDDLLAISRGPARDLVQLVLSGIRQIVTAMTTPLPNGEPAGSDGMPSLTAKEERYLRDFLVEIADRWSELDELLRGVYVSNLESVQRELAELQSLYSELKAEKQALELEVIDMREFSSNQSSATMAVASNFMRLADHQDGRGRPEEDDGDTRHDDDRLAGYELTENKTSTGEHRSAAEEIELLKKQCEEYGRLLEMAKQEIRLSHQERQSQHARLKELSQSLLKDEEVAQLRNELQCEKKRVKLLEMESISLRETEMDLNLKIQSLMINQPNAGGATTASSKSSANSRGTPPSTTTTAAPHARPRSDSAFLRSEEIITTPSEPWVDRHADPLEGTACSLSEVDGNVHPVATHSDVSSARAVNESFILRLVETTADRNTTEDDGLIRRFLADLLMTEKELEAAAAQAKLRKQSNVPTTGKPPMISGAAPAKKKKTTAANTVQDPTSVVIAVDEWVNDTIIVTSVRQLIWVFYELHLMAEEARRIDPELCGRGKWHQTASPPLASFVLHYFLERNVSESDALVNLRRFVHVLSKLRVEYGDIQLFCEFLEGVRSSEELHFFLWLLQAIDTTQLGVNYDMSDSVAGSQPRMGRYVCTFKALYVSRRVFQLLHVKSLKRPTVNGITVKVKPKTPVVAAATTPSVPSSPTKKRKKSRPSSASATSTTPNMAAVATENSAANESVEPVELSVIARVRQSYSRAVDANSGFPLTLENFNNLLLSFADSPSQEELQGILGPFYQPTGDERKLALDVFLVLAMELFSTQLQWRKAQLQALFVRLAKEEELAALLAAKIRKEEEEAAAAQDKKGRATLPEKKEKRNKKAKLSPSKKRQRRAGIDGNNDKYLRGLTRERLRSFLVQGGLVFDVANQDVDALYVALIDVIKRGPNEMHFEDIYSALLAFELLGNDSNAVDLSAWEWKERTPTQGSQTEVQRALVDQWRQMAGHLTALTENDPNKYNRRTARELLRRITSDKISTRSGSCDAQIATISNMRAFFAFAWRVACRRANVQADRSAQYHWCLTEFYFLNQAILTIFNVEDHYASKTDLFDLVMSPGAKQDQLSFFYETNTTTQLLAECSPVEVADLQQVLRRYSLYFAHLFDSYSSARFTSAGGSLTRDQWVAMASEIGIIDDHGLTIPTCEALFVTISASARARTSTEDSLHASSLSRMRVHDEFVIDRPHFVVFLVQIAVKRYEMSKQTRKSRPTHGRDAKPTLAQIVDKFCRDVVVPKAIGHGTRDIEDNFHRKLAHPLVANVLLEHRTFLRRVFFHYAKHATDDQQSDFSRDADHLETRQLKSKHNSMVLQQLTAFLDDFDLLESQDTTSKPDCYDECSSQMASVLRLTGSGVAYLFRAVLAIESADDSHMEFDEFAAAIAAIAALRNPHPFLKWHVKIDAFVQELRGRATQVRGFGSDTASA